MAHDDMLWRHGFDSRATREVHADVVLAIHIVSHDEVVGGGEAVGLRELVVLLDHARQRVGAVGVFSSRGPLTLTRLWTSFIALFAVQAITDILRV